MTGKRHTFLYLLLLFILVLSLAGCAKGSISSADLSGTKATENLTQSSEKVTETTSSKTVTEETGNSKNTVNDTSKENAAGESSETTQPEGPVTVESSREDTSNPVQNAAASSEIESTAESAYNNENAVVQETEKVSTVYLTVDAGSAGTLYSGQVSFTGKLTVYQLLVQSGLEIEGSSTYVSAVNGLREKEHGPMSGWLYSVNGVTVMKSAGACFLNSGDNVLWWYQYDE